MKPGSVLPQSSTRRRIAFYGGSFDPVHLGHVAIGVALAEQFSLSEFVFVPAFHAPHKPHRKPTSAFHRFSMLAMATTDQAKLSASSIELEMPERPYTVETLSSLCNELTDVDIFFVMGADSWADICTWREWEKVLTMTNHIVVTRPGFTIGFEHVTETIRKRIVDLRSAGAGFPAQSAEQSSIYISDAVDNSASASIIRTMIRDKVDGWQRFVPKAVAKYIEKYELYR